MARPPGSFIEARTLGSTGLKVSRLGLGAAPLGNLFRAVTHEAATATIRAAVDAGIGWIDTAPYYGFGLSERRVGDGLRGYSAAVISTKVGRLLRPLQRVSSLQEDRDGFVNPLPFEAHYDYTYDGIMRSWESSLQRLGLARVDMLLIHDVGRLNHGGDAGLYFQQLVNGGFRALEELRSAGEVAAIGLGVNEYEVCLQAMQHCRLDVALIAGNYTLLNHEALQANFMAPCAKAGIAVLAGGVFNSGILATGARGAVVSYYDYCPATPAIIKRVRRIESVCDDHQVSLSAVALQFVLSHPCMASAVLGLGSVEQLNLALQSYVTRVPLALWGDLKTAGLISVLAPTPAAVPDSR